MKLLKREVAYNGHSYFHYYFYCPGCRTIHFYNVGSAGVAPDWTFNGDMDKPTFTPSLRVYTTHPETREEKTLCHLFVTDGEIRYCGDCPHDHNNKTVPLEDIPQKYLDWFEPIKQAPKAKSPSRRKKK